MPPIFPLEEFQSVLSGNGTARPARTQNAPDLKSEDVEKARLTGYEAGYQAGWDDAAQSETEEQTRIGVEFARNLQELGFTFHEARSHVMHALEPLLAGMIDKVLPALISETIGQTIIEELLPLASAAADTPIEVVVPPSSRAILEPMLTASSVVPLKIIEEPSLAEGQIFLRSGSIEKIIDLTGAVDRIGSAINSLYEVNERAFQNG